MFHLRIVILCLSYFLVFFDLHSQGCPSADITLYTQGAVDSFPLRYPDCHEVEGDLNIYGGGIRNLDSLYGIYAVGGSLDIRFNFKLSSILGLSQLQTIGNDLFIVNNDSLLNVNGLEKIASIDTLLIERNQLLEDLRGLNGLKVAYHIQLEDFPGIVGLDSLKKVTGRFRISNSSMQSVEIATQLDTVIGSLGIYNAPLLHDVSGLKELQYVGGFYISNTGIADFEGMTALTVIEGDVSIRGNDSLRNITGLPSLIRIDGSLDISGNDNLRDLTGLNLISEVSGDLTIVNNVALQSMDGITLLKVVDGDCVINSNDQLRHCDGLQSLKIVRGNLNIIGNDSLRNISGLAQLDSIGGVFEFNNNGIDTLDGLNNLAYIGGQLILSNNRWLRSITGLNNLESVTGFLLEENRFLHSISGFASIKKIRGDLVFHSNPRLQHMPSLPGLTEIDGNFQVSSSVDLIDFSGLDSLQNIKGSLVLRNSSLDSLHGLEQLESCVGGLMLYNISTHDLEPLSKLKSIEGPLSIEQTNNLQDLEGLRNLDPSTIYSLSGSQDILIQDNFDLDNCSVQILCEILDAHTKEVLIRNNRPGCNNPLDVRANCSFSYACISDGITFSRQSQIDSFPILYPQCTFIQGDVLIIENAPNEIISLDSLYNVQSIGGNLHISSNHSLTDVDGLSSLTIVGGGLRINFNDNLSSLTGLTNIDPIQLTKTRIAYDLWLHLNPKLNSCSVASICGIVENPEAAFVVQGNGTDCSDPERVLMDCLVGVSTLQPIQSLDVYPNPTFGEVRIGTLTTGEKPFEYMNIYNTLGARVMHGSFESNLSLENLDPGVYTIVCFTRGLGIATGRFSIVR